MDTTGNVTSFQRRTVGLSLLLLLSGGCLGEELNPGEDEPHPFAGDDDADIEGETIEVIIAFANESNQTLETANDTLSQWLDEPESVTVDTIDDVRSEATARLDTYDGTVSPNRETIAELDPGTEVDGYEWQADGEALETVLSQHASMHFRIEEACIGIIDAQGNPDAITTQTATAIDQVQESAEPIITDTEAALSPE